MPTPCPSCPPSIGLLEICHITETPTQSFVCDHGLSVRLGESIRLRAWQNIAGDRIDWVDITNFVRWQGCNNNGPCYDSWFLAPGLFEGRELGGPMSVNAGYSGISDQSTITVTP
jgi:hypothetical protein